MTNCNHDICIVITRDCFSVCIYVHATDLGTQSAEGTSPTVDSKEFLDLEGGGEVFC